MNAALITGAAHRLGRTAALTLADELLKLQERADAIDERVRARIGLIEAVLAADEGDVEPGGEAAEAGA